MDNPWPDFSMYDGLTGYGRYWIMRLRQQATLQPARNCLLYIVRMYIEDNEVCYFSMEPELHCFIFEKDMCFNNALMLSPPDHPFLECVI